MANPNIKSKEIAFNGRLRTNVDGAAIGANDFQELVNFRYTETGIRGVAGHTRINATAVSGTGASAQAIVNLFQYRKSRPVETYILAEGTDNKCYSMATGVPFTGAFGTSPLYSTAGVVSGKYAVAPGGLLCRTTGDKTLLYGGIKHPCAAFIDKPSSAASYDYSEQISNLLTDANNIATIHAVSSTSAVSVSYIGSVLPISGFYIDMNTKNNALSTMGVKYWAATAWADVTNLSDGTISGASALGQSGWVTFDDTQSVAKQVAIDKQMATWYQVSLTASATNFDGVPKINSIFCSIPMQPIQDLWSGDLIPCPAFLTAPAASGVLTDVTSNVYDQYFLYTDVATFANIGSNMIADTGYIIFGSPAPLAGIAFDIPGAPYCNDASAAAIDELSYWDGSAWVSNLSSVVDGTKKNDGTTSMNQSGWVTWTSPGFNTEKPTTILPGHTKVTSKLSGEEKTVSDFAPLYYYKMGWNVALKAAMATVYAVRLVPSQTELKGCSFALQHAARLFLCDFYNDNRNAVMYSAVDTANTFNGEDSGEIFFGGDEELVAGASIFNRFGSTEASLLVLCKRGETWVLSGDDPEKWTKYRISDSIGCIAPKTMCTVNVPSKEHTPGVSSNAAIWLSQRGVVIFSGGSFTFLSDDIGDLFDSQRSTYLTDAVLATCTGFVDTKRNEYHLVVPGIAEYVFTFIHAKWFKISRGNEITGGIPVQDTNGISHTYGYDSRGYVYRLENGTSFAGADIAHSWKTGDFALPEGSIMEYSKVNWAVLVAKAKTVTSEDLTQVFYNDTSASATGSKTVDTDRSGYRLINKVIHNQDSQQTFHCYKFSISTNDETIGYEPLYLGVRYTVTPREVS